MKSPFPGMDPYLEQYWGDVHTRLMVYASNQINPQLPGDLQARVEESLSVEVDEEFERTVYTDVRIVEDEGGASSDSAAATAVEEIADPFVLTLTDEPRTQRYIEIVDPGDGGRVVTAIEILSPANKVGSEGRLSYRRKQEDFVFAGVNLVEIDLIRQGDFVLAAPQSMIPTKLRMPYMVCVRHANQPRRIELYPISLRDKLPSFRFPLRPDDKDVVLQLQPLIDDCYRDGGYHRIDYQAQPWPRLSDEDAAWAASLVA